jgi:hypothetical protein
MFSTLAKRVLKNNLIKTNVRNLYWVKKRGEFKYIGLENSTVDIYEGINNIKFTKETVVLKGETLFDVDSETFVDGVFISKEDTYIVSKNESIMNTINKSPEDFKNSWILKIRDIDPTSKSYNKFLLENPNVIQEEEKTVIKKYYDSTRYTPYTYNSSSIDYNNGNKYGRHYGTELHHTNVNESDLILYIMSNH